MCLWIARKNSTPYVWFFATTPTTLRNDALNVFCDGNVGRLLRMLLDDVVNLRFRNSTNKNEPMRLLPSLNG